MIDLRACTPGQRTAIQTLDAPLVISAGAGSGKTFTLTQRIGYAMGREDGSGPVIDSIDQVCAITYTKKAAAELRSRIRGLLMQEGMADQAHAVDDAWISTIHAMAARILRAHALELGIDPAFEVLGEEDAAALLAQAADEVAAHVHDADDPALRRLLARESLMGTGRYDKGIMGDVEVVRSRVHAMPRGFDAARALLAGDGPAEVLAQMDALATAALDEMASWDKLTKTDASHRAALEHARELYVAWRSGSSGDARTFDAEGFDEDAFREVLYAFPPTSAKYRVGKEGEEAFAGYRSDYARLVLQAEAALGALRARSIIHIAALVEERYAELKGPLRLDNDDLLRLCANALREHPHIAEGYRERFRLIMVDEFQDTDRLQCAIIGMIAAPGLANVCTVGDAQQSIYRFRGADVSVFEEHRAEMLSRCSAVPVELPDNFRSHGDVLKLVDALFAQPSMFGSSFLHLEPRGKINEEPDPVFDSLPRIMVDIIHHQPRGGSAVSAADARRLNARRIAERFAALAREGVPGGDMALLLGGMSNAGLYADALREAGLEPMIVAGSTFSESDEAALASALLRYARDDRDDEALLEVLLSTLFTISDDALLALSSRPEGEGMAPARLSAGFSGAGDSCEGRLDADDRESVSMARVMLARFRSRACAHDAEGALRALLLESGQLDRWQAAGTAGLACAGNMEKACRIIGALAADATGIASLSDAYQAHTSLAKERPGLLVPTSSDHVTIMTVHGSKGLEFPHIAIAEMGMDSPPLGSFLAENIGEETFVGGARKPKEYAASFEKALAFRRAEDAPELGEGLSSGELYAALSAHALGQESAERKRLLYVAITRAVKSVMLTMQLPYGAEGGYAGRVLAEPIHDALGWPTDARSSVTQVPFGGSAPALVRFDMLEPGMLEEAEAEDEDAPAPCVPAAFEVPVREEPATPPLAPFSPARAGLVSYTSLSKADDAPTPRPAPEMRASEAPDEDKATDLGTAFHRLAQKAILRAQAEGALEPILPDAADIAAQVALCGLSAAQEARLADAVALWFGSQTAARFFAAKDKGAEVPFCVEVTEEGADPFYLVGEIDGLGAADGEAFLIDYKTGGAAHEDAAALHEKHLFQAQCYAYALMRSGYRAVSAEFVRVERPREDDPREPQTVPYRFTEADLPDLHHRICEAHRYACEHA